MNYINIKHPDQVVSFGQAARLGLGKDRGLFFPESIPKFDDIDGILAMGFVERSVEILGRFTAPDIERTKLRSMLDRAFDFPMEVKLVEDNVSAVELFHGPSLAFKDFGARFMAECLADLTDGPATILTATSGDTGAAVAHAFFDQPGIRVVILYPRGRISELQEKLFCTLGHNITTYAVHGDFDACQLMVKQAFEDQELRESVQLNSANSINICRLMAQVCYYFEAVARLKNRDRVVVAVPSGNFGNVTAGLIARAMGLPIDRFIAATNANDTVPRFLETGEWEPHQTQPTLTNAMDISNPNNFPRVMHLAEHHQQALDVCVESFCIDDEQTKQWVNKLFQMGYVAEPHTALAYGALKHSLKEGEQGLFLGTAHPAKFKEAVEAITDSPVALPKPLADVADREVLSPVIEADFAALRERMLTVTSE